MQVQTVFFHHILLHDTYIYLCPIIQRTNNNNIFAFQRCLLLLLLLAIVQPLEQAYTTIIVIHQLNIKIPSLLCLQSGESHGFCQVNFITVKYLLTQMIGQTANWCQIPTLIFRQNDEYCYLQSHLQTGGVNAHLDSLINTYFFFIPDQ